jgi:hypothetical protein
MRYPIATILSLLLIAPLGALAQDAALAEPASAPAANQPAQPAEAAPPAMPAPASQAAPAAQPAKPAPAAAPPDAVARAVFTSGVKDHEPVDSFSKISDEHDKVYFFTELHGLAGHTITHRWIYQGKVKADVTFQVKGNRWRVWSSKRLEPSWTGTWQVDVMDGETVLDSATLEVMPAGEHP